MFGKALTSNVGTSNCKTEDFWRQLTAKIDFPIGYIMLPMFADADIGCLKSIYTLFDKYLYLRNTQYFEIFDKKKKKKKIKNQNYFW